VLSCFALKHRLTSKLIVQVVLRSLQAKQATIFYCKAGKDRTGILAMLLLSNAGLSDEQIVADYHECAALSTTAVVLMTPTLSMLN
jgi:Tyrosine phosphatase family